MAGQMRNYDNEDMVNLNNKHLFDKYNCDIFISTWDNKGYSPYHMRVSKKICR